MGSLPKGWGVFGGNARWCRHFRQLLPSEKWGFLIGVADIKEEVLKPAKGAIVFKIFSFKNSRPSPKFVHVCENFFKKFRRPSPKFAHTRTKKKLIKTRRRAGVFI